MTFKLFAPLALLLGIVGGGTSSMKMSCCAPGADCCNPSQACCFAGVAETLQSVRGRANSTPTITKPALPVAKVAECCPDCPDCCSWECCADGCCESCPDCCSDGCCPPGCCTGAKAKVQAKNIKVAGKKAAANCCDCPPCPFCP